MRSGATWMLGRLEKSCPVVLRRILASCAAGAAASAWLTNPRVCVRAQDREQSNLHQVVEFRRPVDVPHCRTSGTSCPTIGKQQEKQEATRRSRSRCTPSYGWLRLMHRLSSSATTVATVGQTKSHPAPSEALGCPRDG